MTIVTLALSAESSAAVREFVRSLGLTPKDKFHTTVFYSEVRPLYKRDDVTALLENILPLTIDPFTYAFDRFGDGVPRGVLEEQVQVRVY